MHISDAAKGALVGIAAGAMAGLGACIWLIPEAWNLFPGDTIFAGAIVCGALGYFFGDRFIDWMVDQFPLW